MRCVRKRSPAQIRGLLRFLFLRLATLSTNSAGASTWPKQKMLPHVNATDRATHHPKDWVREPSSGFLLWCLPLIAGFVARASLPPRAAAVVWTIAFLWMGTACFANALRCHRLHCYISGPVFLLGAAATALFASGAAFAVALRLDSIVCATLLLVMLSFAPELIWRRYLRNKPEQPEN